MNPTMPQQTQQQENKQKSKFVPTKAARITCKKDDVYTVWLNLTYALHHLTEKEIVLASALLQKYFTLKKSIISNDTLNKVLFSTESRRELRESLNMSSTYFQVLMLNLRRKNFYTGNQINMKYIPEFNAKGIINLLYILKVE